MVVVTRKIITKKPEEKKKAARILQPWEVGMTEAELEAADKREEENQRIPKEEVLAEEETITVETPPPVRQKQPWEEDMTEEQIKKADEQEELNRKEERKKALRAGQLKNLLKTTQKILPNHATHLAFDLVYEKINVAYESDEIAVLGTQSLILVVYIVLSYLLHKVTPVLPLLMHIYIIYEAESNTPPIVPVLVTILWVWNQIRKQRSEKHDHMTGWEKFNVPSSETKPLFGGSVEFLIFMSLLMAGSWFVYSTEVGYPIQGTWIVIVALTIGRFVPGFGANSSVGAITVMLMFLVALLTSPYVYGQIARTTIEVMRPSPVESIQTPMSGAQSFLTNTEWFEFPFKLGMSKDSLPDAIRYMLGTAPVVWAICDDYWGPGAALAAAMEVKAKKDLSTEGSAMISNGVWFFMLLVQVFYQAYIGDVFGLMAVALGGLLTSWFWLKVGKPQWVGRGYGVTMTDTRGGFRFTFGDQPPQKREWVLRLAAVSAAMCLVMRYPTLWGPLALMATVLISPHERGLAIVHAIITMNFTLLAYAIRESKPLTRSLHAVTIDAYHTTERDPG